MARGLEDRVARASDSPAADKREICRQAIRDGIERHWEDLLITARVFVSRFGLADSRNSVESIAREVLHDAIVRALELADRYDPGRPVRPWLSSVLLNVARETRRERRGAGARISTIADAAQRTGRVTETAGAGLSEADLLDLLRSPQEGPSLTARLETDELLSLVGDGDREVLQLAVVEGLRGKALASRLQISEGAAYTRLSRALTRLREAYARSEHNR